jgi:hypothetical protein
MGKPLADNMLLYPGDGTRGSLEMAGAAQPTCIAALGTIAEVVISSKLPFFVAAYVAFTL